jgi:acyl-CoA synthetase (AMP-forming)/AMP-acid ligase II
VIASGLNNALRDLGDRVFLVTSYGQWTYSDTHRHAHQLAGILRALDAQRIACFLPDSPELIAFVLAAAISGKSLALLNWDYTQQQVEVLVSELGIELLVLDEELSGDLRCQQISLDKLLELAQGSQGRHTDCEEIDAEILMFTTGTTENPKCVRYRWSDLLEQVGSHQPLDDERWLMAYKLNHFAGVQMLAHILSNCSTLVLAESTRVTDAVAAIDSLAVTHVSSTPTFWRFALAVLADSRQLPTLRHITLGSEPVSTDLLQQLAAQFPTARIVHIYALTEAGSCISVSDGKPGLPMSILERPTDAPVQFRIFEEELQVKTRHGMCGYLGEPGKKPGTGGGWFATGDLVRVEGHRILFVGRRSETIKWAVSKFIRWKWRTPSLPCPE